MIQIENAIRKSMGKPVKKSDEDIRRKGWARWVEGFQWDVADDLGSYVKYNVLAKEPSIQELYRRECIDTDLIDDCWTDEDAPTGDTFTEWYNIRGVACPEDLSQIFSCEIHGGEEFELVGSDGFEYAIIIYDADMGYRDDELLFLIYATREWNIAEYDITDDDYNDFTDDE